jgi:DNA recombination protein RmuC
MNHFEKIGAGLERANNAFNDAVKSYEGRVRPAGQQVEQLGASVAGKDLPELKPVENQLRLPSS